LCRGIQWLKKLPQRFVILNLSCQPVINKLRKFPDIF
jgi:hypothetical protein